MKPVVPVAVTPLVTEARVQMMVVPPVTDTMAAGALPNVTPTVVPKLKPCRVTVEPPATGP
jgi:hypothetical protein